MRSTLVATRQHLGSGLGQTFFSLVSNFFVAFKIVVNVELTHDSILRVRKLFMAVSLNVRVAFNSFLRKIIFIMTTNKAESPYSVRVLSNYLKNTMKKVTPLMMAGVPQDFILLWNIGHEWCCRSARSSERSGASDDSRRPDRCDTKKTAVKMEPYVNKAVSTISEWITENGLES